MPLHGFKDCEEKRKGEAKESLEACNLYTQFHLSHGVGILDSLIASCAIAKDIVSYTKNERHFKMFPAIRVKKPY